MCRPSHAAGPNRALVLSLTFCMRVSLGNKVDLSGCCGWLWKTSFVYVFWFGWLWRFSLKDSLCSSLICGCGGKISFGIWVHMAWKPRSQHFISEWGQHTHGSHNSSTHKHSPTETLSLAHAHTNTCTQWHTLGLSDQSEQSGVGPTSGGWERCWNRSLSQDTPSFTWFEELFCPLFSWFKKKKGGKKTKPH